MANLQDLTAQCIRCGFCLEACPTFQVSSDETQSPRGRITLAEQADREKRWDDSTFAAIDSCLGCRACEPVCPSGVQYGKILELARAEMAHRRSARQVFLDVLTRPGASDAMLAMGELWPGNKVPRLVSELLSGESPEARLPRLGSVNEWPPLDDSALDPVRESVYVLGGCVMRQMFPGVHHALERLLRRVGFAAIRIDQECCGALHAHSGYLKEAERRAQSLAQKLSAPNKIIIDSAGCGSTIKEYGELIGQGLGDIAARAFDAAEFLLEAGLGNQLQSAPGFKNPLRVGYHEACHLVHAQRISDAPKRLLQAIPGLEFVPIAESAMCCGSAGTYNLFQPQSARALLDRKWQNIQASRSQIVALGNPGCHSWIQQAADESGSSIRVMHTVELLEAAFSGLTI